MIRVTGAMRVVGNNRADDTAYDQCADPVAAVHAAMIVMVMAGRRCGVMPVNNGAAAMDNGAAVVDGTASVHHGLCPVARTAAMDNGTAVVDGAASVHHGLCLVDRTTFVHSGTAVVDGAAVTDGAAFVHHGVCLVARTALVHGLHSLSRCFMNGRSCMMTGTLPLHRCFHLVAGGVFPYFRPDLLGLRRGPAAAIMTGCCRLGYAHYERSA